MRDFAGMGGCHDETTQMRMREGARPDQVSGVCDFLFGAGELWEELTFMSDVERAFRYRILRSPMPWLNYHAGARLYPVSDTERCFGVWTADWTADPQDDLTLIPAVRDGVFLKAFKTLDRQMSGAGRAADHPTRDLRLADVGRGLAQLATFGGHGRGCRDGAAGTPASGGGEGDVDHFGRGVG